MVNKRPVLNDCDQSVREPSSLLNKVDQPVPSWRPGPSVDCPAQRRRLRPPQRRLNQARPTASSSRSRLSGVILGRQIGRLGDRRGDAARTARRPLPMTTTHPESDGLTDVAAETVPLDIGVFGTRSGLGSYRAVTAMPDAKTAPVRSAYAAVRAIIIVVGVVECVWSLFWLGHVPLTVWSRLRSDPRRRVLDGAG